MYTYRRFLLSLKTRSAFSFSDLAAEDKEGLSQPKAREMRGGGVRWLFAAVNPLDVLQDHDVEALTRRPSL